MYTTISENIKYACTEYKKECWNEYNLLIEQYDNKYFELDTLNAIMSDLFYFDQSELPIKSLYGV